MNVYEGDFFRQFGARDVLEFGEMPDPKPQKKELLIKVERAGVNFVDIRERQGTYNRPETLAKPRLIHEGLEFLVKAASNGALRPSIARILPLNQTAEAHRVLEDREVQGTILLDTTKP
jgi:NADPH:quinone reductase-like Zn-dependent oxidoreductase